MSREFDSRLVEKLINAVFKLAPEGYFRNMDEVPSDIDTAINIAKSISIDSLFIENKELKKSRTILADNALEACNEISSAGFRHEAVMRGWMASTGNRNKYPKPITALVNEALRTIDTPATDAYANQLRAEGVDMFAKHFNCADISDDILEFAANLRKGNGHD